MGSTNNAPVAVSYGGGTNSVAMVIGMLENRELPDHILFADTGSERPETYAYNTLFDAWLSDYGLKITTVTNGGRGYGDSLEENCLMRNELPSLAYGFKGCSTKWKRQPMDRYLRDEVPEVKAAWSRGELVARCIGIDAGETRRRKLPPDNRYVYRYPLVDWGWDREACVDAVKRHGLPSPGKSSCFFCPAMKKHEIRDLAEKHPALVDRAIAIERNSKAHTIKGLGRHWSWEQFLADDQSYFPETLDVPCDCHDGDEE